MFSPLVQLTAQGPGKSLVGAATPGIMPVMFRTLDGCAQPPMLAILPAGCGGWSAATRRPNSHVCGRPASSANAIVFEVPSVTAVTFRNTFCPSTPRSETGSAGGSVTVTKGLSVTDVVGE